MASNPPNVAPASPTDQGAPSPQLARRMGLFMLIVYGVGDMVGSGIYSTIGIAAGRMGNAVWLAFVGSMVAALFTALSYASLASRYPKAAGAAYITQRAYRMGFLSYVVGLVVAASGLTSMATNSNAFGTYLAAFLNPVPGLGALAPWMIVVGFMGVITFINFWGIRESMWANLVCTAVEVAGLVFVIAVGASYWGDVDYLQTPVAAAPAGAPVTGSGGLSLMMIGSGAVLTFFAFIGFEDMLNVSEEVKQPERTMPLGIIIAVGVTAVLYMLTAITVVSVVDYRDLANSSLGAPLAQVTDAAAPWLPGWIFEAITLFAAANTVLINYIMGSRLLYGMSRQRLLPSVLGRVHARRRTPHVAILTLMVIVIALSFAGDIGQLASATSLLLLLVFCVINTALIVVKYRASEPKGRFEVPSIIPALGVLFCAGLIGSRFYDAFTDWENRWHAPVIAVGLIVFIALLYMILRPRNISEEALAEAER